MATTCRGSTPHYGIGCVLFSRISDAARHAILHENAERIFERWL